MVLRQATRRPRLTAVDAVVIGAYVFGAFLLYSLQWTDLERGYLRDSGQDQNLFEWFFAVAANSPGDALFSTLQNHPLGVNMMANTSVLGLGIPLAPVTWLFGPTLTWAVVLTGGVAASAAGWYWVISRHLVDSRAGAAIGGAFCAFAPPMISHANAHPNFVALFALPLIVSRLILLPTNPIRHGIVLGILVAYQVFVGEEPLLIAATALVIYACARREVWTRPLLTGIGVAALVAVPLLAYPLWLQFFGPQSYSSMGHGGAGNDLAAMTAFAGRSLAGDPEVSGKLAWFNPTEENSFFGWPLVILVVVLGIWLWRVAAARALVITAAVLAVLSLGSELTVHGEPTGIPLPWLALSQLPLYDSMLGGRLAMACVPVIGILLALATARIATLADQVRQIPLRLLWFGTLAAVLLPIMPTPLEVERRPETPAFFTDDRTWRQYAGPDRAVLVVPPPSPRFSLPLHWQADAGLGFPIAEGYFVGPGPGRTGHYGAVQTPTSSLLEEVARTGDLPVIGPAEQAQARADLRSGRVGVVVLGPHERHEELFLTCSALFGTGRYVGGVWVWLM
jgi:hypothetical protein